MVMENENEKSSFQWSLSWFCNSVVIRGISLRIFSLKHFSTLFQKMIRALSSLKQNCNCPLHASISKE